MVTSRQRIVRPQPWLSEDFLELSREARYLFGGLAFYADDHGRETANPALLKSQFFPMDHEITIDLVEQYLLELDCAGLIVLYDVGHRTYFQVLDWAKQDRAEDSRIPAPPKPGASRESRPNFTRNPSETFGVVEREGESGSGGESEGASAGEREGEGSTYILELPPDMFCKDHPGGTQKPCRDCGLQRLRHTKYIEERSGGVRFKSADEFLEEDEDLQDLDDEQPF